jgi:hypothetical protein
MFSRKNIIYDIFEVRRINAAIKISLSDGLKKDKVQQKPVLFKKKVINHKMLHYSHF